MKNTTVCLDSRYFARYLCISTLFNYVLLVSAWKWYKSVNPPICVFWAFENISVVSLKSCDFWIKSLQKVFQFIFYKESCIWWSCSISIAVSYFEVKCYCLMCHELFVMSQKLQNTTIKSVTKNWYFSLRGMMVFCNDFPFKAYMGPADKNSLKVMGYITV